MNHQQPFGLPTGTIRATLALLLVAATILLAFLGRIEGREIGTLAAVAVTFYFATRPRDEGGTG